MTARRSRLTIGQFAAVTHLSIKALRHYHDGGLLLPAAVDDATGYRYYDPAQIETAQTIRRLRELDMPLTEIADVVDSADTERQHELLTTHLHRLERRLAEAQESVAALRRLLSPEPGLVVERRTAPPLRAAAVSAVLDHADVLAWYALAMAEVDALVAAVGSTVTGPAGALIDDAIFTRERGRLTVYLPVDRPPTAGRVEELMLPETELATTVHPGTHNDIDVTYGRLARWAIDRGLVPIGPVREIYLSGPRDTPDPQAWRTEIAWTVATM